MIRRLQALLALAGSMALVSGALAQVPGDDMNELQEKAIQAAAQKVAPSIVQIETTGGTEIISTGPRGQPVRKGMGPTTGLIVSADGYIISSAFNFANKPTAIFVSVPGQKNRLEAKVVATDQTRMLTLLKIESAGLPVPSAAPKKEIRIGQWAIALGRTLDPNLDNPPSMSVGIVSALNRIWGKAIQTDAKVSPVNYGGPLVDIQGRVQGILVPASPRAEGETAGVEWYDSGIGFAIPLEDVNTALPRLKDGKDLKKGLLGISLQSQDIYGAPPVVGNVQPESTAAKAGIRAGDTVAEIDGKPVLSQAQILHHLGNKYEGDVVSVKIKRGNEVIDLPNLRLSGALTAFAHSFLGVLPLRDDPELGMEIRYVYPKSAADGAGLKPGDRIMKVGVGAGMQPLRPFSGRDQLTSFLNNQAIGADIKLEVVRKEGKKTETVTLKLGSVPDSVPDKLPETATAKKALDPRKTPAGVPPMPPPMPPKKDDKKPETGLMKRVNAAQDHEYWVYVPENYDANIAHAVVLWLHPTGKGKEKDIEDFQRAWEDYCKDHHMILVCPKSENDTGWIASESDFVLQVLRDVVSQYTVDRQRVVAHGMGVGGQLAFYLGFNARDLIRGVATTGAVLASPIKDNVANQRLSFFVVAGGKDPLAKDIADTKARLAERKFSVIHQEIAEMGHQYFDLNTIKTLDEMVRWIDSLDRQ